MTHGKGETWGRPLNFPPSRRDKLFRGIRLTTEQEALRQDAMVQASSILRNLGLDERGDLPAIDVQVNKMFGGEGTACREAVCFRFTEETGEQGCEIRLWWWDDGSHLSLEEVMRHELSHWFMMVNELRDVAGHGKCWVAIALSFGCDPREVVRSYMVEEREEDPDEAVHVARALAGEINPNRWCNPTDVNEELESARQWLIRNSHIDGLAGYLWHLRPVSYAI